MGKQSKRNKTNNRGPPRKGLAAAVVPTAAAAPEPTIYETIRQLFDTDNKFDEILKVESKYRHLETFSDDPFTEVCVLYAFGYAHRESYEEHCESYEEQACSNRAIDYLERAKERIDAANANDQVRFKPLKSVIGMDLASLYSDGRDMEKAISSHRWFLANCNECNQVIANHLINLGHNFNRFERFEYTIEVLEGFMDTMKTSEEEEIFMHTEEIFGEEMYAEEELIHAYIGCGEFLKAKAADKDRRSRDIRDCLNVAWQSARIEEGLCDYEAAIGRFREAAAGLQKENYVVSLSITRPACSVGLARTLLQHSTANEAEAFAIFQKELDYCVDPPESESSQRFIKIDREDILFQMGTWYRKLNKWDQSIEALSTTRPDGTMLPRANEAMAQTCIEQYCTDTNLDMNQRTEILSHAKMYSLQVHIVSTEMHLTQAQLFYFNGDKHEAYHHLELYLDARLAECKLSCYTCAQRVRHGSVPFSCESCRVASYCCRKHQKLTWKYERICHKVLCPLLGYWRMTKKKETKDTTKKKQKKHKGLRNEDRREYERVFETFFESICPHVKACVPL